MAVLTAGSLVAIVGATALAVDVGQIYFAKRKAQAAVDLAAIAGAASLPSHDAIVRASLADNGFGTGEVAAGGAPGPRVETLVVTPGRYVADPATSAALRFQPGDAASANALRVTMTHSTPIFFGKLLSGRTSYAYQVSGTASAANSAAFSIGSRLVRLDGGVANALLGALLASSISLSVMDYEALASAKIDLLPFLGAFGEEMNIRAGTYDSLLIANGSVGKSYAAAARIAAAAGQTRAADALRRLASVSDVARLNVKLRDVIDLGPIGATQIGEGPAALAQFDALTLVMAQAQLANSARQVSLDLGVTVPGLASVRATLGIGERPVRAVWLANGRASASAHTAQTRLLLDVRVLGNAVVPAGVRLPVYVELAAGDARLANVRCRLNPADTRVEIDAKPGIVDAWIGDVGAAEFNNMTTPVNPPAAALVSLLGIAVTGRAHATMTNVAYDRLSFTRDDIRNLRPQTVRTRDFTTSLLTRLVGDLDIRTNVIGLPLIAVGVLKPAVAALTQSATPAVDAVLLTVLDVLGLSLGEADVWANGVRCDGGVLVN
jgi:uncharacterized membrane protein